MKNFVDVEDVRRYGYIGKINGMDINVVPPQMTIVRVRKHRSKRIDKRDRVL